MELLRSVLPVLALLSLLASAQTVHTFSFGPLPVGGTDSSPAPFTLIDGQPPNQAIGFAGAIQIRGSGEWWGMEAPEGPYNCNGNPVCGWNFPNNGYLLQNTVVPNPGQMIWDNPGCGPKIAGCTAHANTTVPFIGYGSGVTATVHETWIVNRHPCHTRYCYPYYYSTDSTGGTGTATYQAPATIGSLYRCGSDRRECLIADGGGPHCPRDLPNCKP